MANTDESAYAAVEEELRRNPSATLDELWEKAKEASPAVAEIGRRQFNARYPLQIKRKLQREAGGGAATGARGAKRAAGGGARKARRGRGASEAATASGEGEQRKRGRPRGSTQKSGGTAPAGGGGAESAQPGADREAIRKALLAFASEVVGAVDSPRELVRVLSEVDKHVDKAARGR